MPRGSQPRKSRGKKPNANDNAQLLAGLSRNLRRLVPVVTANSGDEALTLLKKDRDFSIIISDMRMPGMDGATLLEQVHAGWPQAVRILLTGQADMNSTVAAINRGRILRYLSKPWDEPELLATVREGLERLALEREKARLEALTQQQNEALRTLNDELEQRVAARTAELSEAHQKLQRNHLKTIKVFSNLLELRGERLAGHGITTADMPPAPEDTAIDALRARVSWLARRVQGLEDDEGAPSAALAGELHRCEHELLERTRRRQLRQGGPGASMPATTAPGRVDDAGLATEVGRHLQTNEALLQYVVHGDELLACVLRPDGLVVQRRLAEAACRQAKKQGGGCAMLAGQGLVSASAGQDCKQADSPGEAGAMPHSAAQGLSAAPLSARQPAADRGSL